MLSSRASGRHAGATRPTWPGSATPSSPAEQMTAAGSGVGEASLSYLDQAWPIRCECVFGGDGSVRQGLHVLGGDAVGGRDPNDVHVGKLETGRVRCVQEAGALLERGVLGVAGDDEDDRDVC